MSDVGRAVEELAWDLESEDPQQRRAAVAQLPRHAGDPRAAELLVQALADEVSFVRRAAAEAAASAGDRRAIPALVARLADRNERFDAAFALLCVANRTAPDDARVLADATRWQMAQALGTPELEHGTDTALLQRALRFERWSCRSVAARALGILQPDGAAALLVPALQDVMTDVRRPAAEALGRIGDRDAGPALIAALAAEESGYTREVLIVAIGAVGEVTAIEILKDRARSDRNERVRSAAVTVLEKLHSRLDDADVLLPLLDDTHWGWLAAERLAQLGDPRAIAPLRRVAERYAVRDRIRALCALGRLGDSSAGEQLSVLLAKSTAADRLAAATALDAIGDPRGLEELVRLLRTEPGYGMSVCEAIRRIGGPAATTALAAVVAPETDVWVLQPAILALMAIGGSEVVEPLRRALRICESTRAEVATALGRIRDQRAVDDLLDVLQRHFYACGYRRRLARLSERDLSEAEGLVVAAMEALARIGSPRAIQPLLPYLVVPHPRVRRAAAKVLARLGQPQWQERVTGQDEDFHRLGLSGDRSLVAWFIRLLGSDSRHRRLAAAGALAALGEPEWSGLIRGDEDDRTRLLQSPDPRVAEALLLMLGTEEDRAARRQTAEALVRLATATPALLHDSWRRIHRAVTTPHRDEHVDHSDEARAYMHDDRNDYHVDQGLGLEFPAKPPS